MTLTRRGTIVHTRAVKAMIPLILLTLSAWLQAADVVLLTDGDRLTGTIQKLEKGKLFFKSKYSESPLEIDWALISSLSTESDIKMTLRDGAEKIGRLVALKEGFAFTDGADNTELQPSAVVSLQPKESEQAEESPGWFRRARSRSSVSADFGQSYSGLSRYNQLSSNSEIHYKGDRWDGTLVTHYDYYGATDSSGSTYQAYGRLVAERYLGGDHFFLFPYIFLGRQTGSNGGKGQMRQFGGGAGWTFGRHKADQVSLYSGIVRSTASGFTEVSENERLDTHLDGPIFVAGTSWEKTLKNKITTSVRLYYFKPILETGHHGMATDASA